MDIKQTEDASWFMQDSNKVETPIESTDQLPENQNEQEPLPIQEEVRESEDLNLVDVFEKLRDDKTYNFAFWEDKKIESYEDVVEFIDMNADLRYEQAIKTVDKTWYESKSPVFQEFAKMAEFAGDDMSKLYSIIESQKVIDDYSSLDTTDLNDAELVIENYMRLRNEPKEVIEEEIADLRERNKLSERANKYKPILVSHFENEKKQKLADEQNNIASFYKAIDENEKSVLTFLSNKEIGGMKLKDEDKDIIYNNLSYNPDVKGFTIYKKIEQLQAEGKFDTLAKAIMLIENEERFDELYTNRVRGAVAKDLRGKLKFASDTTESHSEATSRKKENKSDKVFNPFTGNYT